MTIKLTRRACLAAAAALPAAASARAATETVGAIKRLDPGLDALIDVAWPIEVLSRGHQWSEGPVWVPDGDYLLFSDVPGNVMWRWCEKYGPVEFMRPSGLAGPIPAEIREAGSNGLAIEPSGTLLSADTGNRAIMRIDLKTKARTVVVDRYQGKRFNGCNDVIRARDGTLYFTDPPYGFAEFDKSPLKELDFNGVFRLGGGGKLAVVDKVTRPNGVALSPDEKTLYVGVSDDKAPQIIAYALGADGLPTGKRVLRDFTEEMKAGAPGLADGLKVDRGGNLFATGPGGVHVLAADGKALGLIATGKPIANCGFGADGWLYLTSADIVCRVKTRTRGAA